MGRGYVIVCFELHPAPTMIDANGLLVMIPLYPQGVKEHLVVQLPDSFFCLQASGYTVQKSYACESQILCLIYISQIGFLCTVGTVQVVYSILFFASTTDMLDLFTTKYTKLVFMRIDTTTCLANDCLTFQVIQKLLLLKQHIFALDRSD